MLAKTELKHPASVARYAACELGLPKAASLKALKAWEISLGGSSANALDCYRQLMRIVEFQENASTTAGAKIKARENVGKFIKWNVTLFDFPFEWAS